MSARISPVATMRWIPSTEVLKQGFRQQPAGTWVAISLDGNRVVGQGATATRAEHQAKVAGETATFLVRVPDENSSAGAAAATKHNGHSHPDGELASLSLPSLYRGIYKRVAHKLSCDPSYVSRVARGERVSKKVSSMLQKEIERTMTRSHRPR